MINFETIVRGQHSGIITYCFRNNHQLQDFASVSACRALAAVLRNQLDSSLFVSNCTAS